MNDRLTLLQGSCLYSLDTNAYPTVIDHPDFRYLCELIQEIQLNQGSENEDQKVKPMFYTGRLTESLNSMRNVLRRMFGVNFEITIVDNFASRDFFGCNIYPSERSCSIIADRILEKEVADSKILKEVWLHTTDWQLDLDSKIFYDTYIGFNAAEIVVLMFYNIENIIFNMRPVERTNYIVSSLLDTKSVLTTKLARASICKKVFIIPLIIACRFKSYPYQKDNFLDGTCIKGHLMSVYTNMMRKMIAQVGNSQVNVPLKQMDEDITQTVNWFFSCVDEMRYSTRLLSEALDKLLRIETSPYIKNILSNLLLDIGEYTRKQTIAKESAVPHVQEMFAKNNKAVEFRMNQYKVAARKKIDQQLMQAAKEGFFDLIDNIGNMKRVSQREIDMIRVQGQKVQNADDKMFVLDNLHSKLEVVDASLAILESGDKEKMKKVKMSKSQLLDQKKQLDMIREEIIKRQVDDSKVSLVIDYPKGYQG